MSKRSHHSTLTTHYSPFTSHQSLFTQHNSLLKLLFIIFPRRYKETIVPVLMRSVMLKVGFDGGFKVAVAETG
jgi:hypothetical protein